MNYTPYERKITRAKIEKYGTIACIEKAIEESTELTDALIDLRNAIKSQRNTAVTVACIMEAAMEYADVVISVDDTMQLLFSDIWSAAAEGKRDLVYRERLPKLLKNNNYEI